MRGELVLHSMAFEQCVSRFGIVPSTRYTRRTQLPIHSNGVYYANGIGNVFTAP